MKVKVKKKHIDCFDVSSVKERVIDLDFDTPFVGRVHLVTRRVKNDVVLMIDLDGTEYE